MKEALFFKIRNGRKMEIIQAVLLIIAAGIQVIDFVCGITLSLPANNMPLLTYVMPIIFIVLFVCSIIPIIYYTIQEKEKYMRRLLITLGIRNILFLIAFLFIFYNITFSQSIIGSTGTIISSYAIFHYYNVLIPLLILLVTLLLYFVIKYILVKKLLKSSD